MSEKTRRMVGMMLAIGLTLALVLLIVARAEATGNQGECPQGFTSVGTGFSGLSWTADGDYVQVILVGGPPDNTGNNQDPDGRNKSFFDVEEGDVLSRVAHDISHLCLGEMVTTTTTTEATTSTTAPTTTTSTTPTTTTPETTSSSTTPTTSVTTTLPVETTTVPTTSPSVPGSSLPTPTLVVDPEPTTPATPSDPEELPFTGPEHVVGLALLASTLIGGGWRMVRGKK
jgi:hypothetical protein